MARLMANALLAGLFFYCGAFKNKFDAINYIGTLCICITMINYMEKNVTI